MIKDISNLNKKVKFNNNNPENNSNISKLKLPKSFINKIKEKYKLDYDEVYIHKKIKLKYIILFSYNK